MLKLRWITGALMAALLVSNPVAAQQSVDETRAWQQFVARLEPGATVELRLKDGETVRGTVLPGSTEALLLLPYTRVPVPARAFAFSDIARIERWKEGMKPGYKVLLGVGAAVGTVLLTVLALVATLE